MWISQWLKVAIHDTQWWYQENPIEFPLNCHLLLIQIAPGLYTVTVVPGPVAVFCMVYHYTKRAMLTRLLGNVGPVIYVVLLNKYFVILPVLIQ